MRRRFILIGLLLVVHSSAGWCGGETIRIGTSEDYWYPYTYAENGQARGMHIDMALRALNNLGYQAQFVALPWKRCLLEARQGQLDAVVSASYRPERAAYLIYPDDADQVEKSRWRLMQVEYVVLTLPDLKYEFSGDLHKLPRPVRAPLGYSITEDLRAQGIEVQTAQDIRQCLELLIVSRRGAVITPPQNARGLNGDPRFAQQFRVHAQPVASKSYFMVFARQSRTLSALAIVQIWEELVRLREDENYMEQLFERYEKSALPR
jgi:polar amino acid transport system substrate-binding protein